MARIVSVGTAVPQHRIAQSEARSFAANFFGAEYPDIERLLGLFDHTEIETRYICQPPEWYTQARSFVEKNEAYIDWSLKLGSEAIANCLDRARVRPEQIDQLIFVSTTGLATPSMDARLIGHLGFGAHTRRTPIWGLGCAGGVAGVAHAHHHLLGQPGALALVVSVELCSLTFHFGDKSKSNLVATALFGDGAAAVLLAGGETDLSGTEIVDTRTTLWPDSLDVMGWNFETEGMQVVFSRAIPSIVHELGADNLRQFVADNGLSLTDVDRLITHPGGAKVIQAYEEALALTNGKLAGARAVLRDYGNMSSASVLFVLQHELQKKKPPANAWGLMSALGPGFSSELALLRF
jgi:alkylresorcinol/alkylpyrone synthase